MLGGTGWLGSEIAREAVAQGAEVVCLARGESGPAPDGAQLVRADRRAAGAYDQLMGPWDDVIELSYDPDLVISALEALGDKTEHWTLISSVSVYAHNNEPYADETATLVEPRDLTEYPDAKVAAELASAARNGDRLLIARPGLIVGPGDPTDRFGYWPARLHRGGRVLTPSFANRLVQVIDVADLAQWVVQAGTDHLTATVNAVGTIHTMEHFFAATGAVTHFQGEFVIASDETLRTHNVGYWAGPRSLPLWLPEEDIAFAQRNGSAYLASGGSSRPIRETISRVLIDEIERGGDRPRRSGLSTDEEAAVLNELS